MPTIGDLRDAMVRVRQEIEDGPVSNQADRLRSLLVRAERRLGQELTNFYGLATKDGRLVRSVENLKAANRVVERAHKVIQKHLVDPGVEWSDGMVNAMRLAGEKLARANLRTPWVSQDVIDAVFRHVDTTVEGVLRVGRTNAYDVMATMGRDVGAWFQRTLLDAIVEELPVQGAAGSLATRIAAGGRIGELTWRIRSGPRKGQLGRRSMEARSNAIARVESAKVLNDVHQTIVSEALGDTAVYVNDNPEDDRTTEICREASKHDPMTMEEWSASRFGRPPRLNPFHLCRSVLIGGRPEWFEDRTAAKPKAPVKAPPKAKPKAPRKVATIGGRSPTTREARLRMLEQCRDAKRPIAERMRKWALLGGNDAVRKMVGLQREWKVVSAERWEVRRQLDAMTKEMWNASGRSEELRIKTRMAPLKARLLELAEKLDGYKARAHDLLAVGRNEGKVSTRWATSSQPPALNGRVDKDAKWLSRMMGDEAWSEDQMNRFRWEHDPVKNRASASHGNARIYIGDNPRFGTLAHEMGHHVEYALNDAVVSEAAGDLGTHVPVTTRKARSTVAKFLRWRLDNSPADGQLWQFMSKFGGGYEADEVGRGDKFGKAWLTVEPDRVDEMACYTGKDYGGLTHEVLSMGVELLYRDPIGFALRDPQWFKFTLGVLRGVIR